MSSLTLAGGVNSKMFICLSCLGWLGSLSAHMSQSRRVGEMYENKKLRGFTGADRVIIINYGIIFFVNVVASETNNTGFPA